MLDFMFRLVSASLWRHRLRAGLTILGIAIGIEAVIYAAALGAAGAQQVQQQMNALGEDFVWIRAGSPKA
jgi:ABC-type antimicrobial peptide transport system permease subunit